MTEDDLMRGDRVRLDERLAEYHGCKYGTVHAIWTGAEDTVEVYLDTGVFTCTDPSRLMLMNRLKVAQ